MPQMTPELIEALAEWTVAYSQVKTHKMQSGKPESAELINKLNKANKKLFIASANAGF